MGVSLELLNQFTTRGNLMKNLETIKGLKIDK